MIVLSKKVAVLSHILPPEPSGQSILISRLLAGVSEKSYCLISRKNYDGPIEETHKLTRLPGRYYHIKHKINRNHLGNILRRKKLLVDILQKEEAKVLVAFSGDFIDIPAGYHAAREMGIKFVPYMADWYAYQWVDHRKKWSKFLERRFMKGAAAAAVPNEFLAEELKNRYGAKTVLIRNMVPLPDLKKIDETPDVFDRNMVNIVFTGAVYRAHFDAFRNLIQALKMLDREDVKLHIFNSNPKDEIAREGIGGPHVQLHSQVSEAEVARIQRKSDILFLPLGFHTPYPEVIRTSTPGKMGDYMASGRPILIHAPQDSFLCWYHRHHASAMVVGESDPKALLDGLNELMENVSLRKQMADTALRCAAEEFDIFVNQKRFVDFINSDL